MLLFLYKDNAFTGIFKQAGHAIPLDLLKGEPQAIKRPQEPAKPYSYYSEEVTFKNKEAGILLAGTLTLPKKEGNYPAVILISGSGPQNRDEELFGHKPFLVLADHLTKNGIAVLRYDDRGVDKSQGDFKAATISNFITDAESAVAYLKTRNEIDKKRIGLIGHEYNDEFRNWGGEKVQLVESLNDHPKWIDALAGIVCHLLINSITF